MRSSLAAAVLISLMSFSVQAQEATPPASPWTNESQAAIVQASGNSVTESYSLKQASSYTKSENTIKAAASYLKTSGEDKVTGEDEETARKWDASLRYERALTEKWSAFVGQSIESDKYAGYTQRNNTDVGGKYIVAKTDVYDVLTEGGYRYVHQDNVGDTVDHYHSLRAYVESNYKFNPTNSAKLWVEYIPGLEDSEDPTDGREEKEYLLNAEASVTSTLSTVFSLKVAYLVKYDSFVPEGTEKADTTLTTALVAKF